VSLWDVLVSIFWFMLLGAWLWLLITIFADLFRDHDLSGWAKALWALFLIVVPWLGVLVYVIARGRSMNERAREQAARREQQFQQYVQHAAASSPSTADELEKLADLRDRETLSEQEFAQAKAHLLATRAPGSSNSQADLRTSIG
jgi:flagellar biosynthesis/type III secretory pathway M-ring protein FliF/YscJ